MRASLFVAVSGLLLLRSGVASACGGSGPGGTGACEFDPTVRSRPRIGASVVATETTILFGDGRRAAMERQAAFATLAWPVSRRTTMVSSIGGVLGGALRSPRADVALGPGMVSALGLAYRAVDGRGAAPLVTFDLTASFTSTATALASRPYEAFDVRASVLVGKTLFDVVTPFVLARAFGGPAFYRWDDGARVQGTDLHKVQLGGGLAAHVDRIDLFVEAAPLGERSLAAGAGVRF